LFETLREWFERRRTLRELRVGISQYGSDFNRVFAEQINLAEETYGRGNPEQALAVWNKARARFPDLCLTTKKGLRLLLDLGLFDEADALMREGRRRYPHYTHCASGYVQVAYHRGDRQDTLRRCQIIRAKFPRLAEGYTFAAVCLAELDRHDEAEAMIERAVRKLPQDFDVLVGYARHAARREDWKEALRRWNLVKNRFDHVFGPGGAAHCLRQMGRYAEAETIAAETCERFPTDPWAYVTLAGIAADKGDLDRESQHWVAARERCPFFALAYTAGAEAERRVGREAEADDILSLAVTRIRSDLGVHLQYAYSAHHRNDWASAAERWALVCERFPDCDEAHEKTAEALLAGGATKQGAAHLD
jgi:tetratricopeptide (TPR) repeat protein